MALPPPATAGQSGELARRLPTAVADSRRLLEKSRSFPPLCRIHGVRGASISQSRGCQGDADEWPKNKAAPKPLLGSKRLAVSHGSGGAAIIRQRGREDGILPGTSLDAFETGASRWDVSKGRPSGPFCPPAALRLFTVDRRFAVQSASRVGRIVAGCFVRSLSSVGERRGAMGLFRCRAPLIPRFRIRTL